MFKKKENPLVIFLLYQLTSLRLRTSVVGVELILWTVCLVSKVIVYWVRKTCNTLPRI
ncbi:hypothetical protein EDC94DRAFT_648798 [Helicostylum pulchrum]|nr:hypothetical protein EDC94DRAFT_648798 [Helicostylum pulchrum]